MTTDNFVCKAAKIFAVLFLGVLFVTAFTMTNCAWADITIEGPPPMLEEPDGDIIINNDDINEGYSLTSDGFKQNGYYTFAPEDFDYSWDEVNDPNFYLTVWVGSEVSTAGTVLYGANTVKFNQDIKSNLWLSSGNISFVDGAAYKGEWLEIKNFSSYFEPFPFNGNKSGRDYLSTLSGVFETDWISLEGGTVVFLNDNANVSNLKTSGFSFGEDSFSGLIEPYEDSEFSATVNNVSFSTVDGPFIKVNEGGRLVFDNAISLSSDEYNTLKVCCEAENSISAESVFISSGRVDIKGVIEGSLEVEEGATFSPGNSAGTTEVNNGNFTLDSGSSLLMEILGSGESGNDILIVSGDGDNTGKLILTAGAEIELVLGEGSSLGLGESFTAVLTAENSSDLSDILSYVTTTDFTDLKYVKLDSGDYDGMYAITGRTLNANEVPEPSTWALLVLGAAGLLYWRKKNA